MSEFFFEYGLFLLKSITLVVAIVAVIFLSVVLVKAASGGRSSNRVRFFSLNEDKEELQEAFVADTEDEKTLSALAKKAKEAKAHKKSSSDASSESKRDGRIFLIEFDGDVEAKTEGNFEEEVEAVLALAQPERDQVVVKLKSPGGYVFSYGIASEHLKRIKEARIPLTVCVDEIAASGGYMMASVADKIIAAPFSLIGSVGVVAEVTNLNKLLTKNGVEHESFTAGEYKRTVTPLGKITEEARQKFQEDLDITHEAFKEHIKEHRPDLDVSKIATGEHWLGRQALNIGLVDEIGTSGRLIQSLMRDHKVYKVAYKRKKEFSSQLSRFLVKTATSTVSGFQKSIAHQPKY